MRTAPARSCFPRLRPVSVYKVLFRVYDIFIFDAKEVRFPAGGCSHRVGGQSRLTEDGAGSLRPSAARKTICAKPRQSALTNTLTGCCDPSLFHLNIQEVFP